MLHRMPAQRPAPARMLPASRGDRVEAYLGPGRNFRDFARRG